MSGKHSNVHRALRQLHLSPSRLMTALFLAVAFNCLAWRLRDVLCSLWQQYFEFWLDKLGIAATVRMKPAAVLLCNMMLPQLEVAIKEPDAIMWWSTLGVITLAYLLTILLPERYLPLHHFVRLCCFIQATALGYFAIFTHNFPISASSYVTGMFESAVFYLLLIPWVHAAVYYVLDFSFIKKVFLSLVTLVFIVIALPSLAMVHLYLLTKSSLILLPLLYLVFGPWLLFVECIALYGWAMSWQSASNGHR